MGGIRSKEVSKRDKTNSPNNSGVADGIKKTGLAAVGGGLTVKGIFSFIGFSSSGPVGGSFAAAIQSGIANVTAGSTFAIFQSLAMTKFLGAFSGPLVIGSAIGGGGYGTFKIFRWYFRGKYEQKGEDKQNTRISVTTITKENNEPIGEDKKGGSFKKRVLVGCIIACGSYHITKRILDRRPRL